MSQKIKKIYFYINILKVLSISFLKYFFQHWFEYLSIDYKHIPIYIRFEKYIKYLNKVVSQK